MNAKEQMREQLRKAAAGIAGVYPADQYPKTVPVGALRRAGLRRVADPSRMLTLVEVDGVLRWEEGAGHAAAAPGLRRGFRARVRRGDVIDSMQVDTLELSDVGKYLSGLDDKLTPGQGLKRWTGAGLTPLQPGEKPAATGRILLFIHGTFSNNQSILSEIQLTPEGRALLGRVRASGQYTEVLAFDHPTVAVSPMLNALDLARRFEGSQAEVDVICHSRGGLVTRWWLEVFDRAAAARRAILVGSPLDGTSLAAPPRLRNVLSYLTNLNRVLGEGAAAASTLFPFLAVVSGLVRMTAVITSVASNTPLIDAAVALIPGLAAQSRVDNNFELDRLNVDGKRAPEYFAVKSNFETQDPGWKFWKVFVDVKKRVLDAASDVVFPRENDLVVDTESMTILGPKTVVPDDHVKDFGTTDQVHHTNYFRQAEAIRFIAEKLKIPLG